LTIAPDLASPREPDREPSASPARLALLVLEGYLYLAIVIGIFVAAVAFLVWGLVNRRPLIGLVAIFIGVPLLITTFRAIRAVFFRRSRPEGIVLTPQVGLGVLTAVEEIRSRIHAPRVHQVLITDQFNAAAVQIPRAGLFWPRNLLMLGYPMLATLSEAHVRAVIAHELGHLTYGHGRLSSWVHRTRLSWLRLMHDLGVHGATPAHAHLLFRWYVPRLNAQAAAVSRQQERLADRLAAELAGLDTTAEALVAMEVGAAVFERDFWPGVFKRVASQPTPPSPFAEMGPQVWADHGALTELVTSLLERPTDGDDSHPSLGERLARLGRSQRFPSQTRPIAADRLLGDRQREIASGLDAQWQSTHAAAWRQEYEDLRRARERLAHLTAIDAPTPQELFEYGTLLEAAGRTEEALHRYQSATAAGHVAAGLAHGRILLGRDDPAGLVLVEAAMDAQPSLVDEGCRTAIAFLENRGREADAERFRVRRARQTTLQRMADAERERLSVVDRFGPCTDAGVDVSSLARRLAIEPTVSSAYLVAKELRHSSGTLTVLALISSGGTRELGACLKREGLVPEHVEVAMLERRDHQLRTALERTTGALVYERR